jgi:hypothetical protein
MTTEAEGAQAPHPDSPEGRRQQREANVSPRRARAVHVVGLDFPAVGVVMVNNLVQGV